MRNAHYKLRLTADQLADLKLPTGRTINLNEAWRELFDFRTSFLRVLGALHETGRMAPRADGYWRVWDLYGVIKWVGRFHSVALPNRPDVQAHTNRFPDLHWLPDVDERLWERAEEARTIRKRLSDARYLDHRRDPITRQWRIETLEEGQRRLDRMRAVGNARLQQLSESLSDDREYWKSGLLTMATIAVELREAGFGNSARLCSSQLAAAVALGQTRLGLGYRHIRTLVGHGARFFQEAALTAASYWPEQRGLDLTLDEIARGLPEVNALLGGRANVDERSAEEMLLFFEEVGLLEWAVEFSLATWNDDDYWASSLDRRVALTFGRIRTLAALLEEGILSLAQRVNDAAFAQHIESRATLRPRLRAFLAGPGGRGSIIDPDVVQRIFQTSGAADLRPPIDGARLAAVFRNLGLVTGDAPLVVGQHAPESVLAALICLRNLTSHRFPILRDGDRAGWFDVWEEHIKSINRSVLWAAVILWLVSKQFRA